MGERLVLEPVGEVAGPTIATLYGPPGAGKTTMAAHAPKPVIARLEAGTRSVAKLPGVLQTPLVESYRHLIDILEGLRWEDHDRVTVILDSVSALDALLEKEVVDGDPKADTLNAACGGYGAGAKVLAGLHREIHWHCRQLLEAREMNVIAIGHSAPTAVRPPDGEPYDVLGLKMNPRSAVPWIDDVDCVALLRTREVTAPTSDGRTIVTAVTGRELVMGAHGWSVTKNRFGVEGFIPAPFGTDLLGVLHSDPQPTEESPDDLEF